MSPETMAIIWASIAAVLAVAIIFQGWLIYKLTSKVLQLRREKETGWNAGSASPSSRDIP